MATREQNYAQIRRLLDSPLEQFPNPDKILGQMMADEQALLNRLALTGKPWAMTSRSFSVSPEKREYVIKDSDNLGKIYMVLRETHSPESSVPVQFTDLGDSYGHQFETAPYAGYPFNGSPAADDRLNFFTRFAGEIAFYRKDTRNQTLIAAVKGADVHAHYKVFFAGAALDKHNTVLEDSGAANELSDFIVLRSAIALLPYAQWKPEKGSDWKEAFDYNSQKRAQLAQSLNFQLGDVRMPASLAYTVERYIRSFTETRSFDLGHWND